jgi:hypothetical protein
MLKYAIIPAQKVLPKVLPILMKPDVSEWVIGR